MVEPLLVADNLECHVYVGAVVVRLHHLSKGTLANRLQRLVPVGHVVVGHFLVATVVIVKPVVEGLSRLRLYLLRIAAEEPYVRVLLYLFMLVVTDPVLVQFEDRGGGVGQTEHGVGGGGVGELGKGGGGGPDGGGGLQLCTVRPT